MSKMQASSVAELVRAYDLLAHPRAAFPRPLRLPAWDSKRPLALPGDRTQRATFLAPRADYRASAGKAKILARGILLVESVLIVEDDRHGGGRFDGC
jgi:hypothetical protein